MSFLKRRIDVTIKLASGTFGDAGDTVTLVGHKVGAYISMAGGDAQGALQCQIYGLPLDMLNRLTSIGPLLAVNGANSILIAAGTDGAMSTVYQGVINQSWAEMSSQPDVALNIQATSAADIAVKPANASSFKGAADAALIMGGLATMSQLKFENNGVTTTVTNAYLTGTALDQIKSLARAAHINWDIHNNTLAIWPIDGNREGIIPVLSPSTGMVGYPAFSSHGLIVTCIYNNDIKLGGKVKVESSLVVATGFWTVITVAHSLESENTGGNGQWFTTLYLVGRSNE